MQVMNAVKGLLNRKDKLISIVIAFKKNTCSKSRNLVSQELCNNGGSTALGISVQATHKVLKLYLFNIN